MAVKAGDVDALAICSDCQAVGRANGWDRRNADMIGRADDIDCIQGLIGHVDISGMLTLAQRSGDQHNEKAKIVQIRFEQLLMNVHRIYLSAAAHSETALINRESFGLGTCHSSVVLLRKQILKRHSEECMTEQGWMERIPEKRVVGIAAKCRRCRGSPRCIYG